VFFVFFVFFVSKKLRQPSASPAGLPKATQPRGPQGLFVPISIFPIEAFDLTK
jgi:hypothetical protein